MRRSTISVCLVLAALAACARLKPPSANAPASGAAVVVPPAAAQGVAPTTESVGPPVRSTPEVQQPITEVPAQAEPTKSLSSIADQSASTTAATSETKADNSVPKKAKPPTASSSAKSSQTTAPGPLPAAPAATGNIPDKATETQARPPTLDLASLEQRLRDTRAIGVFTKLSLKNQVDDLLNMFRAYHRGERRTPLADLRQRYNLLLLKVLTLLQDSDAPLAAAISSSREAIWAILTDPDRFAKI